MLRVPGLRHLGRLLSLGARPASGGAISIWREGAALPPFAPGGSSAGVSCLAWIPTLGFALNTTGACPSAEGEPEPPAAPPRDGDVGVLEAGREQVGVVGALAEVDLDGLGGDLDARRGLDEVPEDVP